MTTRRVTAGMRGVFVVGCALTFVAGFQLYVLSEQTDEWFAWTIASPLTAAFLGAYYWSVALGSGLCARQQVWATARVAVPGVLTFVWLTGLATLAHLEAFHLDEGPATARLAAWSWLVIYLVAPPVQTAIFVAQVRTPGADPARESTLPGWFRAAAVAIGAGELAIGIVLLVAPGVGEDIWAWTLTSLTARAIAAWLVGHGIVLLTVAWSDDWRAVRTTMSSTLLLVALQVVAAARYEDEIDWDRPAPYVHAIVLALLLAGSIYGSVSSRSVRRAALHATPA